jgi:(p)ppGpp synthase/HD superfamily hydrolase
VDAINKPAEEASLLASRARVFAADKHRDQLRKYSDQPYTVHLDGVVRILKSFGNSEPAVLAAAYLHDTVEDTNTNIQELYEEFGEEVAELVYWLTDAEKGKRQMRKLMSAWRLGRAPWDAKIIKLADLIDNTEDICRRPRARRSPSCRSFERLIASRSFQAKLGRRVRCIGFSGSGGVHAV